MLGRVLSVVSRGRSNRTEYKREIEIEATMKSYTSAAVCELQRKMVNSYHNGEGGIGEIQTSTLVWEVPATRGHRIRGSMNQC